MPILASWIFLANAPAAQLYDRWRDNISLDEVERIKVRSAGADWNEFHKFCTKTKPRLKAGFSGAKVRCIVPA